MLSMILISGALVLVQYQNGRTDGHTDFPISVSRVSKWRTMPDVVFRDYIIYLLHHVGANRCTQDLGCNDGCKHGGSDNGKHVTVDQQKGNVTILLCWFRLRFICSDISISVVLNYWTRIWLWLCLLEIGGDDFCNCYSLRFLLIHIYSSYWNVWIAHFAIIPCEFTDCHFYWRPSTGLAVLCF